MRPLRQGQSIRPNARGHSKPAALLDIRLERHLGPMLVRWLYLGSLVLIAAMTLFAMLMSWWLASRAGWALDGRPDLSRGWSGVGAVCSPDV
jgi:hypothetical protein